MCVYNYVCACVYCHVLILCHFLIQFLNVAGFAIGHGITTASDTLSSQV